MSGHLKPYKSYVFRDKDPIIDKTRTIFEDSKLSYTEACHNSGVSISTVFGWFNGKTRRPQFATIEAFGRACGKTLVWTNHKK
jgi:hypothetical protein